MNILVNINTFPNLVIDTIYKNLSDEDKNNIKDKISCVTNYLKEVFTTRNYKLLNEIFKKADIKLSIAPVINYDNTWLTNSQYILNFSLNKDKFNEIYKNTNLVVDNDDERVEFIINFNERDRIEEIKDINESYIKSKFTKNIAKNRIDKFIIGYIKPYMRIKNAEEEDKYPDSKFFHIYLGEIKQDNIQIEYNIENKIKELNIKTIVNKRCFIFKNEKINPDLTLMSKEYMIANAINIKDDQFYMIVNDFPRDVSLMSYNEIFMLNNKQLSMENYNYDKYIFFIEYEYI